MPIANLRSYYRKIQRLCLHADDFFEPMEDAFDRSDTHAYCAVKAPGYATYTFFRN